MTWLIILIFVLGYAAIALEDTIRLNKAATALVTGVLCWTVLACSAPDQEAVLHDLADHFGEISGILFFLLGAMVIVELIDAHDGFDLITAGIQTTDKRKLLWLVGGITFFLSALLDNLTTTIVMVSLLRKLIDERETRLWFAGVVIIAANAGGAWSPLGDVTTTMLWIGGQISPLHIVKSTLLPSTVCLLLPLGLLSFRMKGKVTAPLVPEGIYLGTKPFEKHIVFGFGMVSLLFVPVFKTLTHLPPFMGMLFCLGILWIVTEIIHSGKDEAEKGTLSVNHALRKIDTPSILFFLGILIAVSALQSAGGLGALAVWLDKTIGNTAAIGIIIGFLSAIVDNVPLVAAAQGMYTLEHYPTDHFFWAFLAYCAGTGGSVLLIGSAAGIAAMGMEKMEFFWYLKRITVLAAIGFLAGAGVFVLQSMLFH